jgi:hypothetical protein
MPTRFLRNDYDTTGQAALSGVAIGVPCWTIRPLRGWCWRVVPMTSERDGLGAEGARPGDARA